mgnify:CR=1 FL=1
MEQGRPSCSAKTFFRPHPAVLSLARRSSAASVTKRSKLLPAMVGHSSKRVQFLPPSTQNQRRERTLAQSCSQRPGPGAARRKSSRAPAGRSERPRTPQRQESSAPTEVHLDLRRGTAVGIPFFLGSCRSARRGSVDDAASAPAGGQENRRRDGGRRERREAR